jgi:hypothetical protein
MLARRSQLLAGVLLCSALICGCGSGGSSTTSGSTASTPAATTSTSSSTAAATTSSAAPPTSDIPNGPISAAQLAVAVAECKSVIKRAPTLSASLKGKVEAICNKAASGNIAAARAAAREVCDEVINSTPIPKAEKAQALAACKTS